MFTENDYLNNTLGILEVSDGFIINGHKYDQNFKFTNDTYKFSVNKFSVANTTSLTVSNSNGNETLQTQKKYQDNVYFIKDNLYIYKYNTQTGDLELFYEGSSSLRPIMIIDIENNFLYMVVRGSNYYKQLYKIDITTKAVTRISDCWYNPWGRGDYTQNDYRETMQCIVNTDDFIYFTYVSSYSNWGLTWSNSNQFERIWEYNKNTFNLRALWSRDVCTGRGDAYRGNYYVLPLRPDSKYILTGVGIGSANIWFSDINELAENSFNFGTYHKDTGLTIASDTPFNYWSIDNNIFFVNYSQNGSAYLSKFYKFNYDTEELSIIYSDTEKSIKTMLLSNSNEIILLNGTNYSKIFVYNKGLETYEEKQTVYEINHIGLDSNDNLWYVTDSNEIYCETLDDPNKVDVVFEKPMYTYTENNIETYLDFKAESGLGTYAPGNYILELSSNAYFEESHTNVLNIVYESGVVRYNIIICGNGRVKCKVKFRKSWSR